MKVTVRFFGMIAEATSATTFVASNVNNTHELVKFLETSFPKVGQHKYAIAINKKLITGNVKLSDGDEVALLPPFAGG